MKRLTEIQDIWNYFEVLYKNPRNVTRKFEKESSSGTRYNNFGKEVRQWTDWQTDNKYEIIWSII